MKLSIADVEHVALLARLELSEDEKAQYAGELSRILDYVEQLAELDTTDVEPTAHPLPLRDVFRDDQQQPGLSNEEALANAPRREDGCFVVPQIV